MSSSTRPPGSRGRGLLNGLLERVAPAMTSLGKSRGEYVRVDGHELGEISSSDGVITEPSQTFATGANVEPTEYELKTLPRVADNLPWSTFLIAMVELCERFAFYGLSGPFQNYIANKYHDPNGLPGALGLGQSLATAMTSFFTSWCSTTTPIAAIIADQYLGRYPTIFYAMIVYMSGLTLLFVTSLPSSIESGLALPGLLLSMVVIGFGTGGIKSNVSTLIAEQYVQTTPFVRTSTTGRKEIVDPAMTITRIFSIFYLCVNIGSLSPVMTTFLEARVGFWSSYLLCLCMFVVGFVTLIYGKKNYVLRKPGGSPVYNAFRIIGIALRARSWDVARPENIQASSRTYSGSASWDSNFVDELRRALRACRVFLFFPIYWLAYGQMANNFVSQGGQMQRYNIPNDIMVNIDPICIIIMIPVCDRYVFPLLDRRGWGGYINKIFLGFMLGAAAMAWAAFLQHKIYATGPCYTAPGACAAGLRADGTYAPNDVSIFWQIPAYLLVALSEIFASVPGLEFAYTQAPAELKSFVMGLFILTGAVGGSMGVLVAPFAVDPLLTSVYFWLAVTSVVSACTFWMAFRRMDKQVPAAKILHDHLEE